MIPGACPSIIYGGKMVCRFGVINIGGKRYESEEVNIHMKLKYTFEAVDLGDEKILVPVGEDAAQVKGVFKMNPEGAEIVELLKNEVTEEQIVEYLEKKYENDRDSLQRNVRKVVNVLRTAKVI